MSHTPGPWEVFNGTDIFAPCGNGNDGYLVADCSVARTTTLRDGTEAELPYDQRLANARLIAAATDLLVACEAIAEAARQDDPALWPDAAMLAEAALAHAKGTDA